MTSSNACTAFCRFICGNQVSDHCSQQPTVVVSTSAVPTKKLRDSRSARLRFDKADLRRVVRAQQTVDLGDVALLAAHREPELLGREARAAGGVELELRQLPEHEYADHGH